MNNKEVKKYVYWMLTLFGAAALSMVFFFIIYRFEEFSGQISKIVGIVNPILFGISIAYLLKPVCNLYEKKLRAYLPRQMKKLANPFAVSGSMISAVIIVYLLMIIIIPQVSLSVAKLINILPDKLDEASAWIEHTFQEDEILSGYITESFSDIRNYVVDWLSTAVEPNIQNIIEGVGLTILNSVIFLKNIVIGLVVAVYLLAVRKKLGKQSKMILASLMKPQWYDAVIDEISYADSMFVCFLNGKLLDSAIIGAICYVCCLIFKFPNAMLISVIIGVTNIIPFFGPFIGAIPSALLILIVSPIKAFWFLVFIVILQQVDGNIIGPKILGNTTGLSGFWVLFSILVFGGLWGFIGMIIGVPLFAVIYDVVHKLVIRGLKRHGRDDLLNEEKEEHQ